MIREWLKFFIYVVLFFPPKAMRFLCRYIFHKKTNNVLIIQLHFIGDVIIITPIIELLKKRMPYVNIDLWLNKSTLQILEYNPHVNSLYVDNTKQTRKNTISSFIIKFLNNFTNILAMWRANYDYVIDYTAYFDSALVSSIISRKTTIGMSPYLTLKYCYDYYHHISYSPDKLLRYHYADALKYVNYMEYNIDEIKFKIYLSEKEREKAFQLLDGINIKKVVIAPFAGWSSKEWNIENFITLADLLSDLPAKVFLIGANADNAKINKSKAFINSNVDVLFGKTNLLESVALIESADLFIGLDSSMCYAAESVETKSIIMYGSTNATLLQSEISGKLKVVYKDMPCSSLENNLYCGDNTVLYKCENNHQCMRSITVEEIFNLSKKMLFEE